MELNLDEEHLVRVCFCLWHFILCIFTPCRCRITATLKYILKTKFRKKITLVVIVVFFVSFLVFKNNGIIGGDIREFEPGGDIRKYLKPPNPYRIFENTDKRYSQAQQDITVYDILPIRDGFFIEIGAYNGQVISNTLWLERKHNWTGLLIEANPDMCHSIDNVKRIAWRLCACISNDTDAMFMKGDGLGGISDTLNDKIANRLKIGGQIKVPCFTLFEALDAVGVRKIDYFSLDVEGAELLILQSIMDDLKSGRIKVRVWTIEYRIYDGTKRLIPESIVKLNELRAFFKKVGGYSEFAQLGSTIKEDGYSLDVVFVENDLFDEYCKRNQTRHVGNTCRT